MSNISREEHDKKETWLREYFQQNPGTSTKTANDAVFQVFRARIRNQTVYRIRAEVREQLGMGSNNMESHARGFFQAQPSASTKAVNEEIYKVFQGRIQNRIAYRIRQEVRHELGLEPESLPSPRQQRPLTTMERKPPNAGNQQEFDESEGPPPNEPTIIPYDDYGNLRESKRPPVPNIPGVGPASRLRGKKKRFLVEGTPEQLQFLNDVLEELRAMDLSDLSVSSSSNEFVILERK